MLALTQVGPPPDTPGVYAEVSFSPSPLLWVTLAAVGLGALAWLWFRRSRTARGPLARQAVFSLLGDVTEGALPIGWTDEQIVVLIGDVRLDLRTRPPGRQPSFASSTLSEMSDCTF